MIARAVSASLSVALVALIPAGGGALRRHRLILPTPPLPHSLTVDESEWSVIPSERVVATGEVSFQVYDRGQDAHNLTVQGPITPSGPGTIRGQVWMQSGGSATIVADLPPGTYNLYCSMFMGTPQSHYALGMHTLISVR